jgi:hypothetical protein
MSSSQPAPIRQQIIDSLFSKIAPDGQREETLITHLKVWEDGGPEAAMAPTDTDGKKVRYLLLAGECLSSDYTCNGGLTSNGVLSGQDRSSLPP